MLMLILLATAAYADDENTTLAPSTHEFNWNHSSNGSFAIEDEKLAGIADALQIFNVASVEDLVNLKEKISYYMDNPDELYELAEDTGYTREELYAFVEQTSTCVMNVAEDHIRKGDLFDLREANRVLWLRW